MGLLEASSDIDRSSSRTSLSFCQVRQIVAVFEPDHNIHVDGVVAVCLKALGRRQENLSSANSIVYFASHTKSVRRHRIYRNLFLCIMSVVYTQSTRRRDKVYRQLCIGLWCSYTRMVPKNGSRYMQVRKIAYFECDPNALRWECAPGRCKPCFVYVQNRCCAIGFDGGGEGQGG